MQEALNIKIKQVMQCIADEKITPSALSPFYAEEPAANQVSKLDVAFLPLVKAVCDPVASVSARIISPEGVVATCVYADKSSEMLVRHWLDKDGLHNFREVQEKDIADEAALRLMLDIPPSRLDIDAELSDASFCALLGLIDGWRERTLLSLIDRKPNASLPYAVDEIYAAFRRSVSSSDMRWLTPLVRNLYPGNLDVSQVVFKEGILAIEPKFAKAGQAGIKLSPLGEELCASLSTPLAAVKLSVSWLKDGAIFEEGLIGLRGMGMYCTVEATEENGGKVVLQNSSGPMIELYIHSKLTQAFKAVREVGAQGSVEDSIQAVPAASSESVMAKDQEPAKKFCAACGKPIKAGAKFCDGCGAKI